MLLLGSNDVANDVVHDAFIEIYQRWNDLVDPGPYLHKAVLNRCRDVHRKRARVRRLAPRLLPHNRTTGPQSDPLEDVLAKLPFNHRAAIVLKFYYGLKNEQIAIELNCAPGSVGPWINRGLDQLRKALQ